MSKRKLKTFWRRIRVIQTHPLAKHRPVYSISKYISWLISTKTGLFNQKQYLKETILIAQPGASSLMHAYFLGLPEFDEMSFLIHFLRADDSFVDVGANMGIFSLLASSYAGCKCEAFEPVPQTFNALDKMISVNKINDKVKARNIGISNEEGQLYFTKDYGTTNRVVNNPDYNQIPFLVKVNVRALDEAIDSKNVKLLKIDVEGFEWNVLQGATKILSDENLWTLIVEINGRNEQFGVTPESILEYLSTFGYEPFKYFPYERRLEPEDVFTDENRNTIFIKVTKINQVIKRLEDAPLININGKSI